MGILSSSPKLGESRAGGAGVVQHKFRFLVTAAMEQRAGAALSPIKVGGFGRVAQGEIPAGNEGREWSERRERSPRAREWFGLPWYLRGSAPCLGCDREDSEKSGCSGPGSLLGSPFVLWISGCSGLAITLELCFELDKNLICTKAPPARAALKNFFS